MTSSDLFDRMAAAAEKFDSTAAIDPLQRRSSSSLAELILVNLNLECPPELVQPVAREDGMARRIVLADPLKPSQKVLFDSVRYLDGRTETVLDMTEKGWGAYRIDPATGRMTHTLDGKEKRLGYFGKYKLAKRLGTLAADTWER